TLASLHGGDMTQEPPDPVPVAEVGEPPGGGAQAEAREGTERGVLVGRRRGAVEVLVGDLDEDVEVTVPELASGLRVTVPKRSKPLGNRTLAPHRSSPCRVSFVWNAGRQCTQCPCAGQASVGRVA